MKNYFKKLFVMYGSMAIAYVVLTSLEKKYNEAVDAELHDILESDTTDAEKS